MSKLSDAEVVQKVWSKLGSTDPYWSVLTEEKYRAGNFEDNSEEFWKSGKDMIDWMNVRLESHFPNKKFYKVLDYGCGVGRLLKAYPGADGADISIAHLDVCKTRFPDRNLYFIQPGECPDGYDLIYSVITLQHNRPELMKLCILNILKGLNDNGVAFLHLPTFIKHLHRSDEIMEMNYLSVSEVNQIVQSVGGAIVCIDESWDLCGGGIKNACFLIKKCVSMKFDFSPNIV